MARILHFLSTYSLFGLIRLLRLRVMGKEVLVTGSCRGCGSCCRRINLEGRRGWLRSEEEFAALLCESPSYERFLVSGHDQQGFLQFSCSWLTPSGACRDHEKRPLLCRNFPDKGLHFCGGSLPLGCGFSFAEVRPFSRYLDDVKTKKE